LRRFILERSEKFERISFLAENESMRLDYLLSVKVGVLGLIHVLILPGLAFALPPKSEVTGFRMVMQSQEGQQCMSRTSGGASDKILNRYNVSISGISSEGFQRGLATAITRLADLGRSDLISGARIQTYPGGRKGGKSCASFTSGVKRFEIVTGSSPPCVRNNTSVDAGLHMLHEIGHSVGQSSYYGSYQSSTPVCRISGYCTHNKNKNPRNEEFAEVFAAYVHSPKTLQKHCPKAFDFMKKNVFRGKESTAGICQGIPASAIAGATTGGYPGGNKVYGGSRDAATRGYNAGGGSQMGGLAQALGPILAMAMQKDEGKDENPETLAPIQRAPAQQTTFPNPTGMPGSGSR